MNAVCLNRTSVFELTPGIREVGFEIRFQPTPQRIGNSSFRESPALGCSDRCGLSSAEIDSINSASVRPYRDAAMTARLASDSGQAGRVEHPGE